MRRSFCWISVRRLLGAQKRLCTIEKQNKKKEICVTDQKQNELDENKNQFIPSRPNFWRTFWVLTECTSWKTFNKLEDNATIADLMRLLLGIGMKQYEIKQYQTYFIDVCSVIFQIIIMTVIDQATVAVSKQKIVNWSISIIY